MKTQAYQIWRFENLYEERDHTLVFEGTLAEMLQEFPVDEYPANGWLEEDEYGNKKHRNFFFMEEENKEKEGGHLNDDMTWRDLELIESGAHPGWWRHCDDPRVKK